MIYYNNSQACVIYLKDKNTAYLAIEGFVNSNTVRSFMTKSYELCSVKKIKTVLLDSSKLEIIKHEDVKWIYNNIYSLFKNLPLQKVACISSQNVFGERSIKKLIPNNSCKEFREFTKIEDAESWLFAKKEYSMNVVPI